VKVLTKHNFQKNPCLYKIHFGKIKTSHTKVNNGLTHTYN
jgi:hypothetical protein